MSKTVLITGGAGFLGCNLVRDLEENTNWNLIVLDDLSGGFRENLADTKATLVNGSVTNEKLVQSLFKDYRFDYVYHLAAYAAEGLSHFIRRFNYTNNLVGSVNLINQSVKHEVEQFVFTSSIAVYGDLPTPMTEDMHPEPEDPYGIAKYAVEQDLQAANDMFGLDYTIFRPHNVYGEFQNIGDKYRNVVGIFMNQILQGKPLTIFGDGEQKRAFTYIDDILPHMRMAVRKNDAKNEIFNLGTDTVYTVNELAKCVKEALGEDNHPIKHLEERNEVKVAYSDHTKAESVFGDLEETPLQEGVQKMSRWVKNIGARESEEFDNIEIEKNLPSAWK